MMMNLQVMMMLIMMIIMLMIIIINLHGPDDDESPGRMITFGNSGGKVPTIHPSFDELDCALKILVVIMVVIVLLQHDSVEAPYPGYTR